MHSVWGDLQLGSYQLIMADCPWSFKTYSDRGKGKSADQHYQCMTLDDIKALPVADLAAPDCSLFFWATAPLLPQALAVIDAWGFTYKSMGFWRKTTKHGKEAFGTGYVVRCAGEPFLIATRGRPKNSRAHRNVINGLTREHSRKPDEAYRWCETYLPNARRLDMFSRQQRVGWDAWGAEIDHFEPEQMQINN